MGDVAKIPLPSASAHVEIARSDLTSGAIFFLLLKIIINFCTINPTGHHETTTVCSDLPTKAIH